MNSLITKSIITICAIFLSVIIVGLWKTQNWKVSDNQKPQTSINEAVIDDQVSEIDSKYEKVIYTCKVADEEIPAIQIAEVKDFEGKILGVIAHVYQPKEFHLFIEGAVPKWDFSAVSADLANESIKIIYSPQKQNKRENWTLLLDGEGTYLKQNVKDCSEVSDE